MRGDGAQSIFRARCLRAPYPLLLPLACAPSARSRPAPTLLPPPAMSSPSSGDRYEEEEEEDGAYESQAKRLKPSAAAEEGEIEYSGAEESESRRDKVPPPRGGGFSGGVRAPSLSTPAGSGTGGGAPSSGRGSGPQSGASRCGAAFWAASLRAHPRPRGLLEAAARWPFSLVTEVLPGRGVRCFAPLRGGGPPARGRGAEPGLLAVRRLAGREVAFGRARSLPPLRGLLGAFWDIAVTSFALALLLSVTIETCGWGRKRAEGSFSSACLTLLSGGAGR